ncbi:MAG: hypothetical protein IJ806_03575 [Ruminococcus sp.]|nr:hypothetical protein [Ruminococcus sp.]
MKKFLEYARLMTIGAFIYGGLEVLGRGYSHISMGVLGGLCFSVIHILNGERRCGRQSFVSAVLISAFFITACELLTGEILNRRLGMGIWNYRSLPLNFDGQICFIFSFIWVCISALGIGADELARRTVFRERFIESAESGSTVEEV